MQRPAKPCTPVRFRLQPPHRQLKIMRNILIVGSGSIALQHKKNLSKVENKIYTIKSSSSLQQIESFILKNKIQYLIVASISSNHFKSVLACINTNTPFYCEKPFLLRNNHLDLVKKCIRKRKHSIQSSCIGFNIRYHPLIKFLKNAIERIEGTIQFSIAVGHDVTKWRKNRDIASLFSLKKKSGGGAISELSHEIDLAIYLFNKPTSSKLFSKKDHWNKSVDAQTSIIVENSKTIGSISLDLVSPNFYREIRVSSKNSYLKCDLINLTINGKLNGKSIKKHFSYDRNLVLSESLNIGLEYAFKNKSAKPLNLVKECINTSEFVIKSFSEC